MFSFNPQSRFKRVVSLMAIGVIVPLAGFFVGSQSGGGDENLAQAAKGSKSNAEGTFVVRGGPGGEEFVSDLAAKLGVSEDALQEALEALRPGKPKKVKRIVHQKELAAALGVTTDELKAALKKLRESGDMPPRMTHRVDGPGGPGGPGERGLSVRGPDGPPPGGPGGPGRPGGPDSSEHAKKLAEALGISQATVEAAFKKLGDAHKAEHEARHTKFATDLAAKLGLDADKVKAALEELRPKPPTEK